MKFEIKQQKKKHQMVTQKNNNHTKMIQYFWMYRLLPIHVGYSYITCFKTYKEPYCFSHSWFFWILISLIKTFNFFLKNLPHLDLPMFDIINQGLLNCIPNIKGWISSPKSFCMHWIKSSLATTFSYYKPNTHSYKYTNDRLTSNISNTTKK
jgi:hypothetical protein